MIVWETVLVALSMFSAVPVPAVSWNERNMRFCLCAFPLVGLLAGLCCAGWWQLCLLLSLPAVLRGAGLTLLPVLVTGGIHLDGFADTCDALSSRAGPEKRQEILKDPHLGAFAVIHLCMYFIAAFALCTAMRQGRLLVFCAVFGLSRSLSGLALTMFPLRPGSGLARQFADAADRKTVRGVLLALSVLFAVILCCSGMVLAPAAAFAVFLYYRRLCIREFGGLSGDLAGWFVQKAELWMLAAAVLTQYGEAML